MDKFRDYCCEYRYEGIMWGITVRAESFEDAKARLNAMAFGKVLGELQATIPAVEKRGILADAVCRFMNWKNKIYGS